MENHESRKYWSSVISGIERSDDDGALTEKKRCFSSLCCISILTKKYRLEQYQRDLEKERSQKGKKWMPSLFSYDQNGDKWIYRLERYAIKASFLSLLYNN